MPSETHVAVDEGVLRSPGGGRVHFDDTCVLIPEPVVQSRMPRLVKKSYSLPIWRKRSNSSSAPDISDGEGPASPTEDRGMMITVSVPSFAKSRSLTRGDHVHHHHHQPLVPCIVDSASPRRQDRRPSLSSPPPPDAGTIPLRPCCRECYPITEECLKEGIEWQEKFTRGARKRRNSSADARAHAHAHRHRRVCDDIPGFGAIVSVDEIDRRHGTSRTVVPPTIADLNEDRQEDERGLLPSFSRRVRIGEAPESTSTRAIDEEDEEPALPPASLNTSSPPSYEMSSSDLLPALLEAMSNASTLEHALIKSDDERSSMYYTPETSPAVPSLIPSSLSSSPDNTAPMTPPPPASSNPASLQIDATASQKDRFSGLSFSSFELVNAPPSPSADSPRLRYASNTPEQADLLSTSPGRKRSNLSRPHFPGSTSFLKVGAEVLRGVSSFGSGPTPMSV